MQGENQEPCSDQPDSMGCGALYILLGDVWIYVEQVKARIRKPIRCVSIVCGRHKHLVSSELLRLPSTMMCSRDTPVVHPSASPSARSPVRCKAGHALFRSTSGTSLQLVVMAPPMAPAAKPDVPPAIMRLTQSSARSVAIAPAPSASAASRAAGGLRRPDGGHGPGERGQGGGGEAMDAEAALHIADETQHR